MFSYINAQSIHSHSAQSFAKHLRSIKNHWSRLRTKRKAEAKARQSKPKAKPYSFRYNKKGTPVLTIRGRKPPYLYRSEWLDLETTYPDNREDLQATLAKRSITIKPDPKS